MLVRILKYIDEDFKLRYQFKDLIYLLFLVQNALVCIHYFELYTTDIKTLCCVIFLQFHLS